MINFFKQIYSKILKLDNYTNQYLKNANNIEIPALAYTDWAMHFADIEDFKSAIEKLETAMLMSNNNPKPCISLGVLYAKLKEYDKAEQILKEAIKRDSQNAYTYSVLSTIYTAKNKFDKAEDSIKKALKLSPSDGEIYLNYGILYAKMNKKPKAIELLKKSKFLNPANLHVHFLLGVLFFETDKISEAFNEFKNLEKFCPDYKNLNYYMALCYKKEKNYMAVIEYGQRALNDNPDKPSIYMLLAQTYTDIDKIEDMQRIYKIGEEHGIQDFEFFLSWSISLLRINKTEEAKDKVYKAINMQTNNSTALYTLGKCFFKEKNFREAEHYFKQALEINPSNASALADLGMIYYEKTEYKEALKLFFDSIDISKEKVYLYFYIANCYYKLGRFKKSIDYYEKTIEYYPRHIEAFINCTLCLLETSNEKEALRKIRSAYQIDRNSEKIILIYALADLKSGIFSDAIEKTDIILGKNPDKAEAKLIKAHSLINLNKPQEALSLLYSFEENHQSSNFAIYLACMAYKLLVKENPSNYNESMLDFYLKKLNDINPEIINQNEISNYLSKPLNINKGKTNWE